MASSKSVNIWHYLVCFAERNWESSIAPSALDPHFNSAFFGWNETLIKTSNFIKTKSLFALIYFTVCHFQIEYYIIILQTPHSANLRMPQILFVFQPITGLPVRILQKSGLISFLLIINRNKWIIQTFSAMIYIKECNLMLHFDFKSLKPVSWIMLSTFPKIRSIINQRKIVHVKIAV